jgi:hypothetical protein
MKLKDRGFSDKLYFLNFTITWIFVLICIVITLLSGYLNITDLSLVSYGIPTVFAELGVHTGYIVWKAKSENINKHPVIVDSPDESGNLNTQVVGFEVGEEDYGEDNVLDNGQLLLHKPSHIGFG